MAVKRILYLTPTTHLLGARLMLLKTIKNLNRDLFEPVVVCPNKGEFWEEIRKEGIKNAVIPLPPWRKFKYFPIIPLAIWKLKNFALQEKIDLVHSNEFWVHPYGLAVAKYLKIPSICHIRAAINKRQIRNYRVNDADKVIFVSNGIAKPFGNLIQNNKYITIYNGLDLAQFNNNHNGDGIRSEFMLPKNTLLIGMIGRLSYLKGQDLLIKAAPKILEHCPEARFLIVGKGYERDREHIRNLHILVDEFKLNNKIFFAGYRKDIPQICSALDLVVMPSRSEGFGVVNIEAMAMSRPVIASDAGGQPEAVQNGVTGLIIPRDDVQSLASAVIELLKDPQKRAKMGKAGAERVKALFSSDAYYRKIEAVYKELLKIDRNCS